MTRRWLMMVVLCALAGLATSPTQTTDVSRVMREKLQHSERLLDAVVTSNWAQLEIHSLALDRLTDDPRWTILKYPEYATYSLAFKRAVHDLHEAAVQRDLDEAPHAYNTVTLRCVECHRYLARARIAD